MVDGSVGNTACGLHALTVPSDEAETTGTRYNQMYKQYVGTHPFDYSCREGYR